MTSALARVAGLPIWSGQIVPEPLGGGITNRNFVVQDRGERFVVRVGGDIPIHGVMRFNELAASRAAHAAGLSPEVVYAEQDVTILRFIEGRALTPEDVRRQSTLERILWFLKCCHGDVRRHLRGQILAFSPFHIIRDYASTLGAAAGRRKPDLPRLLSIDEHLEPAVGPCEIVFCHNDMLAANFIDDGRRLWLIDWDYAGFGNPLFDLGGLAANNGLSAEQETWLLESYFAKPADDRLRRSYAAMKCAAALREALWGLVSEIYSAIDYDFVGYSDGCLVNFEKIWSRYRQDWNVV